MMGAAIVGIVGAAGVFIYEQIYAEKRRAMLGKLKHLFHFIHTLREATTGLCRDPVKISE